MIFEKKIGLILTAIARYTVVVAHLHISFLSLESYQLLFYAWDPIITRDGLERTEVIGNG